MLVAPGLEETSVAESHVLCGSDAEPGGGAVDPGGRALQLRVIADGGFVDDAVALAVGPFRAPLLITKRSNQSKTEKKLGERIAVGDSGLGFDAVFVAIFTGRLLGGRLWVSVQRPT